MELFRVSDPKFDSKLSHQNITSTATSKFCLNSKAATKGVLVCVQVSI